MALLLQNKYDNLPKQASYSIVENKENTCLQYTVKASAQGSCPNPLKRVTADWYYIVIEYYGPQARDAIVSVKTC